ncbi:MAG TPA: 50S ribosomal protein L24 [Gammaproteobacteria bacterium]|nr:50S ribosomal protein L24 [Gammaproteobacteria bacterium]
MSKIRKGDEVIVIAGRDKGKRGTVSKVVSDEQLLVEGVNVVKRHTRPNPSKGTTGGIIEKEMPIHRSNIALYNPQLSKADRVGIRRLEDGKKVRFFKSTEEVVDI